MNQKDKPTGKQVAVNFHQLETPKTSNPVALQKKVLSYCWWLKSCTTKDDDYPIIYGVLIYNHPRWLFGISAINYVCFPGFPYAKSQGCRKTTWDEETRWWCQSHRGVGHQRAWEEMSHEKNLALLSIESWLIKRVPDFMVFIIPI